MLQHSSASILAVCETWLDENVSNDEIGVRGYTILRKDRDRHGGGVLLYIKDSLAFNMRNDLDADGSEAIWAEILLPRTRGIVVGCIYRPPTDNDFLGRLEVTMGHGHGP